jgi:hypothetical protein
MAYEKEVILNIRHHIEMYEQERIFSNNVPNDSGDTAVEFVDSHIHLGSRQRSLNVPSWERDLEEELGFHGFSDLLAQFL